MSSVTEMVASGMIDCASSSRCTSMSRTIARTASSAPSGDQSRCARRVMALSSTSETASRSAEWRPASAAISARSAFSAAMSSCTMRAAMESTRFWKR